jgi:hypothetical protein
MLLGRKTRSVNPFSLRRKSAGGGSTGLRRRTASPAALMARADSNTDFVHLPEDVVGTVLALISADACKKPECRYGCQISARGTKWCE